MRRETHETAATFGWPPQCAAFAREGSEQKSNMWTSEQVEVSAYCSRQKLESERLNVLHTVLIAVHRMKTTKLQGHRGNACSVQCCRSAMIRKEASTERQTNSCRVWRSVHIGHRLHACLLHICVIRPLVQMVRRISVGQGVLIYPFVCTPYM